MTDSAEHLRLFTIAEIAELLNLHSQTVRVLIKRGELHAERVGQRLRVPYAVLVKYQRTTGQIETPAPVRDTTWRNHPIFTGGKQRTRRGPARRTSTNEVAPASFAG